MMRITKEELAGMEPVCEGYKIFLEDWTAQQGKYDYKDETGEAVGTVHRETGKIANCQRGFHFCESALDCHRFYEPVPWNRFAKVRAYGTVTPADKDGKRAAEILEIVQEFSFKDWVKACEQYSGGRNIHGGSDIHGGYDISGGRNIHGGYGISGGCSIYGGYDIHGGRNIHGGYVISGGRNIHGGFNIHGGNGIYGGRNIHGGNGIYGAENCRGIYHCFGVKDCEGLSNSAFCIGKSGKQYLFCREVRKDRAAEVLDKLFSFGWYPKFTNAFALKGTKEWSETPPHKIEAVGREEAYRDMPEEMEVYLRSLPEFDETIFREITGKAI